MRIPNPRQLFHAVVLTLACAAASPFCVAQQAGGGRIRQQDTFTSTNVLTPGETDDWPLTARDNETFIISVSSDNFDPTLELANPQGAVVAKNDDVRPGEQDSMLLARVAAGGAYTVRVKASKSAAGGEYELTVRRFIASDAPVGARTAATLGRTFAQWHRFTAEAGQTLVVTARAVSFAPALEIYAPNGEEIQIERAQGEQAGRTRAVFRAVQPGVYHARVAARGGDIQARSSYAVTVAVARVFQTNVGDANPLRPIDAGGLDLWTFKAEAGDLVRIETRAAGGMMSAQLSYVPPVDKSGEPRQPEGPVPPFVILPSDPKAGGDLVALFNLAGTYQAAISQPLGLGVSYTLATSRPLRQLTDAGDAPSATLALGGSDYWSLEGTAGQITRLEGLSDKFDAALQLYNARGELVSSDDDGGAQSRNSTLTALLVEPGRYLLRVYAFGNGGSGAYNLSRVANPVRTLAAGARAEGTVGRGGSEIWSFRGQAGQTFIISARSPDFDIKTALYSPDATEIASDDNGGEGTDSLLSVRLPLDGTYTVWVSAQAGGGKYSLRLIEAQ